MRDIQRVITVSSWFLSKESLIFSRMNQQKIDNLDDRYQQNLEPLYRAFVLFGKKLTDTHFTNFIAKNLIKRKENIFQPIVRRELMKTKVAVKDYYLVYLPNYSIEKLTQVFSHFESYNWVIFSPLVENSSTLNNIRLEKINEKKFNKTLLSSKGVICSS